MWKKKKSADTGVSFLQDFAVSSIGQPSIFGHFSEVIHSNIQLVVSDQHTDFKCKIFI